MAAKLRPCPFCGGKAEFGVVPDEDKLNYGGEFVACSNPACGASTNLMFPCKDEVRSLLAEKWNRRSRKQVQRAK